MDVLNQRKRLGGTFAVSGGAITKSHRDSIRSVIKKDLIIIVLKPANNDLYREKLLKKHGDNTSKEIIDWLTKMGDDADDISIHEGNTYEIIVQKNMSDEDVLEKVLDIVCYINF